MRSHFSKASLLAWLITLSTFIACRSSSSDDANTADAGSVIAQGQATYGELCAGCHGTQGEGAMGPSLRDWSRGEAKLVDTIDATMPLGQPERCDRNCAQALAAYILSAFKGAVVCDALQATPRALRLLSRREYEATIKDLLGSASAPVANGTACNDKTFTFDPGSRPTTRVHVAGTFNGWPQTIAAGGYAMVKNGSVFSLTKTLPVGKHQYKFVLDESQWTLDPTNPNRAPDGLGGENSVVDVVCGAGGGTAAPSLDVAGLMAGFPKDTRPEGFAFDTHASARVMSSLLADETMRVASAIAKAADIAKLSPCKLDDAGCAQTFVEVLGRRVFRRPLNAGERDRYKALAASGADRSAAARLALRAMLVSPSFLYRSELGEPAGNGLYKLTAFETASAISYTLTGSMPDEELFAAAEKGELANAQGREKQARRLLASTRARDQLGSFAEQWLGSDIISDVDKNAGLYPEATKELREAMRRETREFVTHVVMDGTHALPELFNANYTYADGALARHYGVDPKGDTGFVQRVLGTGERAGILGHGSVLATTSHSDQTSPIRRGLFVRRRLLCQEFPPPPPNAGGVPKVDPSATTRERFAQHTQNAACKSCHQYIDDVGFGFERFDAMGKVRSTENGKPIDSLGDMNDVERMGAGTHAKFASLKELGDTLASSNAAASCYVRQYYRFARGRNEDGSCSTRALEASFRSKKTDLRELMIDLVTSEDFVVRK